MYISDVKGALEKNATIFMYVFMEISVIHSRSTIIQAYLASHRCIREVFLLYKN